MPTLVVNPLSYNNQDPIDQYQLADLDFMDIYVCLEGAGKAHYRPSTSAGFGRDLDLDVPREYLDDTEELAHILRHNFEGVEMGLSFGGMRLRAAKLKTANGETWAALRRLDDLPIKLDKLGLTANIPLLLRDLTRHSGLILVCGATGQGKTTTAASLLLDALNNIGGVAFTIEDPVEYNLEGRQGKAGYCYQAEIKKDSEWGPMLKRSLRWHPRFIMVGEIRTADAASQLLRAATSGHTVITTMHAGSIEEALEGILHLTEHDLGPRAASLLAAGFSGAIYQSFVGNGLSANVLVAEPNNPGSPARALIRERRIGQTRTLIDQQMALLMREGRIYPAR